MALAAGRRAAPGLTRGHLPSAAGRWPRLGVRGSAGLAAVCERRSRRWSALAIAAALTAAAATGAGARQADPEDYLLLIDRYVDACQRLSPEECTFARPPSGQDAERLACLFDELEARGGAGTAGRHVDWAEGFAASGQPPAAGFPSSIGEQKILMGALIACRGAGANGQ
ncbi:MAG TPA: hypothetical protein VMM55_09750 [Thermohalobaculum sp.]|nr:hypothetical protein [Thermohalobaculum sp.]